MDILEIQKKIIEFRDARDWAQQAMEYWPEWVRKKCLRICLKKKH
jgi:hypothetical protein